MSRSPLAIIANPAAGGAPRRHAARLTPVLAAHGLSLEAVMRWTDGPGDEARLTHAALEDGATVIGALGGDGTISRVGAAIAGRGSDAILVPLAAGTGNDFVKSLAAPVHDAAALVALALDGVAQRIDVGRVDDVLFLNAAGFGFDADVVAATSARRWLRGAARYAVTALERLVSFRGVAIALDRAPRRTHVLAAFANGRVFGGAFRIAPTARLDDGALDAVLVDDAPLLQRLAVLTHVARGTHLAHPRVRHHQAPRFQLRLDGPAVFQADGELYTTTTGTVSIETMPAALRVVTQR